MERAKRVGRPDELLPGAAQVTRSLLASCSFDNTRLRDLSSPSADSSHQRGRGGVQARVSSVLRRLVDIALAGPALLVLAPLMLAIAILVRLDSPGPILFPQMRIGRDRRDRTRGQRSHGERRGAVLYGKPFALLKFRTMHADSRERFPELYRYTYSQEELRTIPIKVLVGNKDDPAAKRNPSNFRELLVDPRVTRVGRFLRSTSLDELPNLWNVLKGDMHLVGPRPDIADNIRYYTQEELEILRVRPGVTGLAQIKGRGLLTFRETNSYDLEYVRNRSLALDLEIFLKTITALLKRDGAS
jgi:lipopolysaccharide/colanic/teichoic acid biosynthesis glycosyltransferase